MLSTLLESFGNLVNLKELYLHYNQLRSLPESFSQLTNLQTFWIYDNPLANSRRERKKITRLLPQNCNIKWEA
ncbi:MAG: leucine-rich repeat domain-containing protein [Candidatus Hermodarchaeota archaeon]